MSIKNNSVKKNNKISITIKYQLTTTISQKIKNILQFNSKNKKRHQYYLKKKKKTIDRSEERKQKAKVSKKKQEMTRVRSY